MTAQDFYAEVGAILGTGHESLVHSPFYERNRWNNRQAGNGRYPGHGLVRWHGQNQIVISFRSGRINGLYESPADALQAIRSYVDEAARPSQ